jgi:hypothetical protein
MTMAVIDLRFAFEMRGDNGAIHIHYQGMSDRTLRLKRSSPASLQGCNTSMGAWMV